MNPLTLIEYLASGLYLSPTEVKLIGGGMLLALGFVLWVALDDRSHAPRVRPEREEPVDLSRAPDWDFPAKQTSPAEAHMGKERLLVDATSWRKAA